MRTCKMQWKGKDDFSIIRLGELVVSESEEPFYPTEVAGFPARVDEDGTVYRRRRSDTDPQVTEKIVLGYIC